MVSRTERRRWTPGATYGDSPHIDPNGLDRKGKCWCCSGWKRPARRGESHRLKTQLRTDPDTAIRRGAVRRRYW